MNTLYYGDNLKILQDRNYFPDGCVDLVYLDPPFNSNRNYNVLFKNESGIEAESQITAFEDTWHWNASAEETFRELQLAGDEVATMIESFRGFIGQNQMMAYLVMMAVRLKELHRVLKPTGSLYLHCDPTASHYLKILLDTIFGTRNFRTEISWKRSSAHNDAKQGRMQPGNIRDVIYFYTKSDNWTWNWQYTEYTDEYVNAFYKHIDFDGRRYQLGDLTAAKGGGDTEYEWRLKRIIGATEWSVDTNNEYERPRQTCEYLGLRPYRGRFWAYSKENMAQFLAEGRIFIPPNGNTPRYKRYLDEMPGVPLQNAWDDIRPASAKGEFLGYPTQKPVELLERILLASSNEGDIVLDPFCGCGTTIAAAQKLNRQWIGIDITHLSIALQKYRLKDAFGLDPVGSKTLSSSLKGTKIIAQGKDEVRNPGNISQKDSDPEGVEQNSPAPHQGAENVGNDNQGFHSGLLSSSPAATGKYYKIIGEPEDLAGARQLATEDRYQFQWWALSLIKARPLGGSGTSKEGKKGSDKGIDGTMVFVDDTGGKAKRVIVQVKSGKVRSGDIRDLAGTIDREQGAIGIFITLEKPSRDMTTESVAKGFYHSPGWNKDYPKLQILTIEELLAGKQPEMPQSSITFKQAEKMAVENRDQGLLGFE